MAATRSLPDLGRTFTATEEDDLDPLVAPPSPTALASPKWSSPTSSPLPSPSPSPPLHPPETPRTPHFYPAISSPLPPAFPSPSPPRYLDQHDDPTPGDFEDARDSYDEGGPGTFSLHHPTRARSDYSIHSAPELETNHLIDPSFVHQHQVEVEEEQPGSPSPSSPRTTQRHLEGLQRLPYTLWDYLQEEVLAVEMDGEEGVKSERVTNFLTVPGEVEKIILFGVIICLDSFLYTFTILPLRLITAFFHLLANVYHNTLTRGRRRYLRLSHKCDLTKAAILAGTLFLLHRMTDASKMYHSVRGQDTIKLYVLFNVLEIADRLCCSFGQDLQDSLFSRQTLGRRTDGSHPHIRPIALFGLNLAYVVAHTLVLFYQLVTLNVAINSYSNALLTLLLSNQFVEIKGSVFKKFEKENLFQLTCADIVERFQLGIMLFIIALRNLIELSSTTSSSLFSILPSSFSLALTLPSLPSLSLLQTIFSPALIVLISECFVDWLKHAFITKFNHIRPKVYGRFIDVLCKDLVVGAGRRTSEPFVDQSPLVSRRLGFAALPLGCLVVRVISQAFEMLADDSSIDECAPEGGSKGGVGDWAAKAGGWVVLALVVLVGWACLIALKLLIGINLRAFASERWASMTEREGEDRLNDRKRPKIGVTAQEDTLDREATDLLRDNNFDAEDKSRKAWPHISRYDMIKSRLW
ncbi:eukaryotic membrane protein family-domain-containing protein [Leucosporidium creatinivorum]|uniref:Eukaryotic membrane protein family-domain-containing protein n=1 Tax=Leucosporidium creatinivorum TaxID=106004 RepID=A0A1Y2D476_9BASI|nr:eukaryotic membrane protein family-domain-containing protein [Leucosporidium creatinivorum]